MVHTCLISTFSWSPIKRLEKILKVQLLRLFLYLSYHLCLLNLCKRWFNKSCISITAVVVKMKYCETCSKILANLSLIPTAIPLFKILISIALFPSKCSQIVHNDSQGLMQHRNSFYHMFEPHVFSPDVQHKTWLLFHETVSNMLYLMSAYKSCYIAIIVTFLRVNVHQLVI